MRRAIAAPSRREAAKLLAAGLLAPALAGHTPYAQWTIYRKRNLFVVAARTDEKAIALARAVAEGLAADLPESRARFTRATDPVRIASLLKTAQIEVAVVAREEAEPMLAGAGPYAAIGPVALRLLTVLDGHLLVTVEDFRARHAYLLAQALDVIQDRLPLPRQAALQSKTVPFHPGALAYLGGEPPPADGGEPEVEAHPHLHPH